MTPRGIARLFRVSLAAALIVGAMVWAGAPESPIVATRGTPAPDDPDLAMTVTPELPSFYSVDPTTLEPGPPGAMIDTQQLAPRSSGPARGVSIVRIMYHSRDLAGNDIPVSGLFLHPDGVPPSAGWPLIALGHGTTGSARVCGTSLTPFEPRTPSYSQWVRLMKPLVERGYAVVATDFQGMGAPGTPAFLIGEIAGRNILDSVRAVHGWRSDVNPDKTVLWGTSQGGQAAAFAAQLADDYAPELRLSGAAILAPTLVPPFPAALARTVQSPEPSPRTAEMVLIATSYAATYPDLELADLLTDAGMAALPAVEELCGEELIARFADRPMSDYVRLPLPDALVQRLAANAPGQELIGLPVLLVQGMADAAVQPDATLAYQTMLCHLGERSMLQV